MGRRQRAGRIYHLRGIDGPIAGKLCSVKGEVYKPTVGQRLEVQEGLSVHYVEMVRVDKGSETARWVRFVRDVSPRSHHSTSGSQPHSSGGG